MRSDLLTRARSAVTVEEECATAERDTPGNLCAYVARMSHPSVATAWTCGLASTSLLWLLRLHRHDGTLYTVAPERGVGGHVWVQDSTHWYDPTIGQFGDHPISGTLPHPLFTGNPAQEA